MTKKQQNVLLAVLSCLIAVGVVSSLVLPAVTVDNGTYCSQPENADTEACLAEQVNAQEAAAETDSQLTQNEASASQAEAEPALEETVSESSEEVSDPTADTENEDDWLRISEQLNLTGNWASDLVAAAEGQLGYSESVRNFEKDASGEKHGYTRYGAWNNTPYNSWNSLFVGFLLNQIGITNDAFPEAGSARDLMDVLDRDTGKYKDLVTKDALFARPGDLLFYKAEEDGKETIRTGIVSEVNERKSEVTLIEGDLEGRVDRHVLKMNDPAIVEVVQLPENPDQTDQAETVTETTEITETETGKETAAEQESETTVTESVSGKEQNQKPASEEKPAKEGKSPINIRAGPDNLLKFLTSLNFSGVVYNPANDTFTASFNMGFKINADDLNKDGYYYLDLGPGVTVPDALLNQTFYFKTEIGTNGGSYQFMPRGDDAHDGYWVQLKIDPALLEESMEKRSPIFGNLNFSTIIHQYNQKDDGSIEVSSPVGATVTIKPEDIKYPDDITSNYDIDATKTGEFSVENDELIYRVVVRSQKGTPDPIHITDVIKPDAGSSIGLKDLNLSGITVEPQTIIWTTDGWSSWYEAGSEKPNGNPYSLASGQYSWNADTGELKFDLPKLGAMTEAPKAPYSDNPRWQANQYVITYRYKIKDLLTEARIALSNRVEAEATDPKKHETVKDSAQSWINQSSESRKPNISKWGWFDPTKQTVEWSITFNSVQNDGAGYVITDRYFGTLKPQDLKITPKDGVQILTDSNGMVSGVKILPNADGKNLNTYRIDYSIPVTQSWDDQKIPNTAYADKGNDHFGSGTEVHIPGASVNKYVVSHEAENGLMATTWKVDLITPTGVYQNPLEITDILQSGQWIGKSQLQVWNGGITLIYSGNNAQTTKTVSLDSGDVILILKEESGAETTIRSKSDLNRLSADKKFTSFRIQLKNHADPNIRTIRFEYRSVFDPSGIKDEVTEIKNTVRVENKETTASWPFKNPQSSKNGWYMGNDQIGWKITANTPSLAGIKQIEIEDVLPEHLDLVSLRLETDLAGGSASWKPGDEKPVYDYFERSTDYAVSYDQGARKLKITIRMKDGSDFPADKTFSAVLTTKIDTAALRPGNNGSYQETFNNTADVSWDSKFSQQPSSSVDWTHTPGPEENGKISKLGAWNKNEQSVGYSVNINKDGKPLSLTKEDGSTFIPKTLTLVDTLKYDSNTGNGTLNAQIIYDSVQLYKGTELSYDSVHNIRNPKADPDAWSWKYSESQEPYSTRFVKTIETVVPNDGTPYILVYEYRLSMENPTEWTYFNIKNEAKLLASGDKAEVDIGGKWEESDTSGTIGTGGLVITKVDAENSKITIPNAEFSLYEYRNGSYVKIDVLKTDDNGRIRIPYKPDPNTNSFKYNTAYYIEETKPADGYIQESNPKKIYFHYSNPGIGSSSYPDDFKGTDLMIRADYQIIPNVKKNEWTIHKYGLDYDGETKEDLAGAEFTVWAFDGHNWQKTDTRYVTDDKGNFTVKWEEDGKTPFAFNTGYYLQETKAPAGYRLPDNPQKYYFWFSNPDQQTHPKKLPSAWSEDAVDLAGGGTLTEVLNEVDEKQGTALKKVWKNEDGNEIQIYDTPVNLEIYQVPADSIVKIEIRNGENTGYANYQEFMNYAPVGSTVEITGYRYSNTWAKPQDVAKGLPKDTEVTFTPDEPDKVNPNNIGNANGTFTFVIRNVQKNLNIVFSQYDGQMKDVKVKITAPETTARTEAVLWKTVRLSPNNGWKVVLRNLPKQMEKADGTKADCLYYVREQVPFGYTAEYENDGFLEAGKPGSLTVTNTVDKNAGAALPDTGGFGYKLTAAAGVLLVALAAVLVIAVNKKRQ